MWSDGAAETEIVGVVGDGHELFVGSTDVRVDVAEVQGVGKGECPLLVVE